MSIFIMPLEYLVLQLYSSKRYYIDGLFYFSIHSYPELAFILLQCDIYKQKVWHS